MLLVEHGRKYVCTKCPPYLIAYQVTEKVLPLFFCDEKGNDVENEFIYPLN